VSNRIDTAFAGGGKLFIPYVTTGFPSVAATSEVLDTLVGSGADIIELGYPFSDPTADGPVIQASSKTALDNGFHQDDYFDVLAAFRQRHPEVPVVVFSYYNPVFHTGVEAFAARAAEAGADAMLLVDLPVEEQGEVAEVLAANNLHLVQLIAPTTPEDRARKILAHAGGFVYQISVCGVTGMRTGIVDAASELVASTKALTDVPVALGFGVSRGEQAAAIAEAADAVIVGSAVINCIAENQPDFAPALGALAQELADAIHNA
jgi:tryptophan synthase alpha chain